MQLRHYLFAALVLSLGACSTRSINGMPVPGRSGDVVVVDDDSRDAASRRGPRALKGVPPGHYPPPGECRVWHQGRPPGQQPPPRRCSEIRSVPRGAFVLYNGRAWDSEYDWRSAERRKPGSVPRLVLQLMANVNGR